MGKTTRLAMMLVLFFVIGAAVLVDKDDEKAPEKTDAGQVALDTRTDAEKTWGPIFTQGAEEQPLGRNPTAIPRDVPDHVARRTEAPRTAERSAPVAGEAARSIAARTYRVESGDSLEKISSKVYGSRAHWKRIFEANTDKMPAPNKLRVGMEITIPALTEGAPAAASNAVAPRTASGPVEAPRSSGKVAASAPAAAGTVENGKVYHVVQKGERLWDIASRYYGSGVYWRTIVGLNPDKIPDGQTLKVGTRILIGERSKLQRGE